MRYYVQHGAGLGGLVADAVRADLGAVDIVFQDDSGLVLDSPRTPEQVARLRYVKNAFQVLASVPRGQLPGSVGQLVKTVRRLGLLAGRRGTPFRTMVNVDGTLVGLPGPVRGQLEPVIAEQTGGRLNLRGGGGVEFWVIGRRDFDVLMLCERLSGGRKAGPRGSLSADLAALLISACSSTRSPAAGRSCWLAWICPCAQRATPTCDRVLHPRTGRAVVLLARASRTP